MGGFTAAITITESCSLNSKFLWIFHRITPIGICTCEILQIHSTSRSVIYTISLNIIHLRAFKINLLHIDVTCSIVCSRQTDSGNIW